MLSPFRIGFAARIEQSRALRESSYDVCAITNRRNVFNVWKSVRFQTNKKIIRNFVHVTELGWSAEFFIFFFCKYLKETCRGKENPKTLDFIETDKQAC